MGRRFSVRKCLVKSKVGQGQARQWRVLIVSSVDSDRALENVYSVTTEAATQRQKSRRRVAKHARLPAITLKKIAVARPHQRRGRTFAGMLAVFQAGMNVQRIVVFMIRR